MQSKIFTGNGYSPLAAELAVDTLIEMFLKRSNVMVLSVQVIYRSVIGSIFYCQKEVKYEN
ncbi:MAG: hypothetical protein PHI68_06860 [Candidatus Cloacimonetes bacterium]|nr:hypothetical protein [Candidatus Cloacimonadota bacterium]